MNVNKVTATVKYTQDTGKGVWKSLELGCEASINEREDWQTAQATLYGQLAQQFKALWSQNGDVPHVHAPEGHRIDVQPSQHESGRGGGPPTESQPQPNPLPALLARLSHRQRHRPESIGVRNTRPNSRSAPVSMVNFSRIQ